MSAIQIEISNDTNTNNICYNIFFNNEFAGSIGIDTFNLYLLNDEVF